MDANRQMPAPLSLHEYLSTLSRTDVFALRWHNTKTGASGYSPVCKNKWVSGKCNMKQTPCSQCPNLDMAELSDEYLFNHLAGRDFLCRDVVGMYALRPDETCRFLALDFDEENWKADIRAVCTACSQNGLSCAVEISRSGNGAHVWFFFTEPVPAKLAREFGFRGRSADSPGQPANDGGIQGHCYLSAISIPGGNRK